MELGVNKKVPGQEQANLIETYAIRCPSFDHFERVSGLLWGGERAVVGGAPPNSACTPKGATGELGLKLWIWRKGTCPYKKWLE